MDFPILPGSHRILNVHQNVPGVLKNVNNIIADLNVNIKAQVSTARGSWPQGSFCHVWQACPGNHARHGLPALLCIRALLRILAIAQSGAEFPDIAYMTQAQAWRHHTSFLHMRQELIL